MQQKNYLPWITPEYIKKPDNKVLVQELKKHESMIKSSLND